MPIGRKRWSLHDGPQGSLRRLRCQLAEDGCADSQVVLAKQLLDEKCELEADRVANFKQALQWLTCAAEQAHPEARHMLRRCVGSGVMCAQSACVVRAKAALAASRQETVARKAARDLFNSLSNGEQFITTAQLERRIRDITAALHDDCADDDSPEEGRAIDEAPPLERLQAGDANGTLRGQPHTPHEYPEDNAPSEHIRNLTVDNLVSAAVDYCQGELPLESYELTLTDPSLKALDQIPLLQRAFLHPIVFIQVLYLKILYYFGGFSFRLSNVELSLVLIAYLSANTESLYHLVPLVLYYVSFAAMVICTFKMLHAKRQFIDFRKWSGLFLRYSDGNLQPDESENLFVRNNLGPFVQFFVALLVNLFLYPFIATQWVPFSEFCVVSVLLMFLTLLSFGTNGSPYPDPLALLSFGINVLAKYPYEKDTVVHQGWRFLDLHISNYPSYMVGNGVEFCLNARVFFSLLIPTILCVMAKRCKWQGLLRYTVPHCVTLSWLQMFITCSHGCTAYGLVRGTLALVCSFLFVPLVGVVSVALPAAACVQRAPLSAAACGVLVLSCVCACVCAGCVLARWERTRRFVTPFQLSIGAISLIYVGAQLTTSIQDGGVPSGLVELISDDKTTLKNILKNDFISDYEEQMYQISWDDYYTHCNSPAWAESNMADTQVKCAVLDGATVSWEGYVKQVKLRSTKNRWREWLQYLPPFTHEYVKCYYGQPYTHGCHHSDDSHTGRECQFVATVARNMGKRCHLDGYNEYTYEVAVTMETSRGILKRHADITLSYEHYFTNYTRLLRTDDKIAFKGTISNEKELYNVGNKVLNVKAYEINCLECKETRGMISKLPASSKVTQLVSTVVSDCAVSAKYILNFILNPVIVFK